MQGMLVEKATLRKDRDVVCQLWEKKKVVIGIVGCSLMQVCLDDKLWWRLRHGIRSHDDPYRRVARGEVNMYKKE